MVEALLANGADINATNKVMILRVCHVICWVVCFFRDFCPDVVVVVMLVSIIARL